MKDQPAYILGHSAGELARLELQGTYFKAITRRVFEAAGIGPGMRVLDIGCGAGDVSLLVAELVGSSGYVLGIDHAPEAVQTAASRAVSLERRNVEFQASEVEALPAGRAFDAIVGRFVLMHQADPARTLRIAAMHAKRGGIIAMVESHMRAMVPGVHSHPLSPTYDRIMGWMIRLLEAAGAHPDMGLRLRATFIEAGLPSPSLSHETRVEGGPDADAYRYTIDSLRSMRPMMAKLGIVSLTEGEVNALEARLREEVVASRGVLASPPIVGAWCRRI